MKKAVFLFLITAIFGVSYYAQNVKPKVANLPGFADWTGEDSDKILNDAAIKIRLQKLLGKKNYSAFLDSFETINPVEKNGNVLFSSGCLIHACGHLESAIAIDLVNNTIHAAIYNEKKKTAYFNERNSKTPESITNWANRLSRLKNNRN
ncbi:MAG: hypothetical protein ACR2HG_13225 [Pyrinomonadaceae bacterium]